MVENKGVNALLWQRAVENKFRLDCPLRDDGGCVLGQRVDQLTLLLTDSDFLGEGGNNHGVLVQFNPEGDYGRAASRLESDIYQVTNLIRKEPGCGNRCWKLRMLSSHRNIGDL
jgi:hypothetical protein